VNVTEAMADQLTTVSKERLATFFGKLSDDDMESLDATVRLHLGL
ncbi:MAG: type II toxin-antitoxin system PemK/MazF family toxin, partial [Nitrospira sp. SB0661_bin_20]|nr:type II toxin-antitoxin system PemK/MazF family toxin [Nitrospira sp. SB0661_bin_20]